MMDFLKGVLVILLVIGYVVVPDRFPGPVDDLVAIVLAIMGSVGRSRYLEG